jgi:tricorn protease
MTATADPEISYHERNATRGTLTTRAAHVCVAIALALMCRAAFCAGPLAEDPAGSSERGGYYRFPAIHGDLIVFTAEGDLWEVGIKGGVAHRLTSHPSQETHAAFSPDGKWLAYSAGYEGPDEVYVMPVEGGLPTRCTFEGGAALVQGWTPDGKVIYSTGSHSTLPNRQLATVDPKTGVSSLLPLSQASDGVFDPSGKTLYFTRMMFQGSSTKRYQGGTAQNLWKYELGGTEAKPLSADYPGTSKLPMWWQDRVYFITDRDGTMNIWSMQPDGGDLKQHTHHKGWDVKWASLSEGRIVYTLGADLRLLYIASNDDAIIPIALASDFDHEREKWVKKPMDYLTTVHLSPDGDRIVLTARGQVFVAPAGPGRLVEATRDERVRYREAIFMPDGKSLLVLSDQSGELEFEKIPPNGVGKSEQITHDGKIFRFDGTPSPDGKWFVWQDKNQELWLYDVEKKKDQRIAASKNSSFADLTWSPDSQWLAYVVEAENTYRQIQLYRLKDASTTALTDDRVNSFSPAWTPDGKWMYFLSERHFQSLVGSPWGSREPEPYFGDMVKMYLVSLVKDQRSPFEQRDELHPGDQDKDKKDDTKENKDDKDAKAKNAKTKKTKSDKAKKKSSDEKSKKEGAVEVKIDLDGIQKRVMEVPVTPGNYSDLAVNDKHLYWLARNLGYSARTRLETMEITNDDPKSKTLAEDIQGYELSNDNKKLLIHKGDEFFIVDSGTGAPAKLEKAVDLRNWMFSLDPREEWRQMFVESWRLMRDYFYDPDMHGVDWAAVREKYLPLAARVTDRAELNDLIADMVGELSALHIFVVGGDFRRGPDDIAGAGLGAALSRDEKGGGYRIDHIYQSDPDYPERESPLARPGVDLKEGDVIEQINGVETLSNHLAGLLRNQAGQQVLLNVKPASGKEREVIVKPINLGEETNLRYDEWEYSRRMMVEELGKGDIGYVHLRAMGSGDIADWTRDFYPVFNRKGLIIDVRHNGGGNIDSWILEKLIRKAWFYWQPRVGNPAWNMQYAFRGHAVVLCDERTGSDGEAFTEGFKRLGIGKVIGTRTWGGEIWLSFDNTLVDKGIASAAENGVYGPEGKWLIEGHGVDPDIVVDNLPHATYEGADAQLKEAIADLQEQIRLHPVEVPPAPPHPNKAFK